MKFTLAWLKEHLETEAPLAAITEALTDLGHEVEGVEDPGETLGAFRIAKVLEAGPHPNADRLRVCRVATYPDGPGGRMEEVQVVCGAPNARTGLVGVFAPPGTYVPGTGVDLKPGVIRGVESNGMLCSERELMLSEDHDGIIDLPQDAPLGARFIDYRGLDDPMIWVKITPNRPDALGVRGIARDLAARGLGRLLPLEVPKIAGSFPCPVGVTIAPELKAKEAPHFVGRLIRGVKNGPSPAWMQARLKAIGLRPISALVDITNYITFAYGRPLHVFDAAKITGKGLTIRRAAPGESLVALDGKTYALGPSHLVIADDKGPESLAGIMGGEASGCGADTRDVFVESAIWDPITIAGAGRALKIQSDARYRFERGIDPAFTLPGLMLATQMILDLCGGEASEIVEDGAAPLQPRRYDFDPARLHRLVGLDTSEADQRAALTALGFAMSGESASPPSWRPDIQGEADLVEEVARIASLSKLKGVPLPRRIAGVPAPILTPLQQRARRGRRAMAALGYNECVTYSFIDAEAAALFGASDPGLELENPISSEMSHLRPHLLPGLLRAAARNQARGFFDLALFELGPVFTGGEPGQQSDHLTGLLVGASAPRDPYGSRRPVDLYDVKADVEAALAALGAPARMQVSRPQQGWWHPGQAGQFTLGPKVLAEFGTLHPKILDAFGVKGPGLAYVIDLAAVPLPKNAGPARAALRVSDFQAVERDFAFVVGAGVEAGVLLSAAQGADKALIASVRLFDAFAGAKAEAQMGPGKKSLALSVRLEPKEGTLTEAEIEAVSAKIIEKVEKASGGVLRR